MKMDQSLLSALDGALGNLAESDLALAVHWLAKVGLIIGFNLLALLLLLLLL